LRIGPAFDAKEAKLPAQESFDCSPIILNSPFSILNFFILHSQLNHDICRAKYKYTKLFSKKQGAVEIFFNCPVFLSFFALFSGFCPDLRKIIKWLQSFTPV
jgi:hypothetical protein